MRPHRRPGPKPFLSTPSARRATFAVDLPPQPGQFLSTPSARRATCGGRRLFGRFRISIHALREEGDRRGWGQLTPAVIFLSTPSARRATISHGPRGRHSGISIHALREEGDTRTPRRAAQTWNFYPRPPRGGRRTPTCPAISPTQFLSTPSARRATVRLKKGMAPQPISIHALREEGDASSRQQEGTG